MDVLHAIFEKPFQVTQFWASDRYAGTTLRSGTTEGHLYKFAPGHVKQHQPAEGGDWFFEVCDGNGGPFAGDFLPRILPTRANIKALNAACLKASKHLAASLVDESREVLEPDDEELFSVLQPYGNGGPMELSNEAYRRALWNVFAQDWGIVLPDMARFGIDDIGIRHRAGVPCAAAMVRAVLPIFETVYGELQFDKQATTHEGGRVFDVMEYRNASGQTLVQRFDITELFGRDDLDWRYFNF